MGSFSKRIILILVCFSGLLLSANLSAQTFYAKNTLITIDKDTLKQAYFKDKIVLMNFWFIGCYPCIREIPELNKIAAEFKDKIVFIAVSKDNSAEQIKYFIKKFPFSFTQILPNKELIESLEVDLYPTNFLYNKQGNLVVKTIGYEENTMAKLREEIEKLVK